MSAKILDAVQLKVVATCGRRRTQAGWSIGASVDDAHRPAAGGDDLLSPPKRSRLRPAAGRVAHNVWRTACLTVVNRRRVAASCTLHRYHQRTNAQHLCYQRLSHRIQRQSVKPTSLDITPLAFPSSTLKLSPDSRVRSSSTVVCAAGSSTGSPPSRKGKAQGTSVPSQAEEDDDDVDAMVPDWLSPSSGNFVAFGLLVVAGVALGYVAWQLLVALVGIVMSAVFYTLLGCLLVVALLIVL